MVNKRLEIIKAIDRLIEEDEKKRHVVWSESAKMLAKGKAAINWAKSRCLGSDYRYISEEDYDEATIECIAINAVAYARKFAENYGLIKKK